MRFLNIFLCILLSTVVYAEAYFSSGQNQVALLELYSSEGCSSCPPADRWLSSLKAHKQLFTKIIPIAFQVDYWDYIGWKDPFASPAHSSRQRSYARSGHASGVYTPELFINGREWRDWRRGKVPTLASSHVGNLELMKTAKQWTVQFKPKTSLEGTLHANLALLGVGITTQVQRGENAGQNLQHDFVVLDWQVMELQKNAAVFQAPTTSYPNTKLAIVAWVSQADQTPVQATGGWLAP